MEMMNLDSFVGEIQRQTGLDPPERVLRLIRRVLSSLDEVLVDDELATLRASVPASLQGALVGRVGRAQSSVDRLFTRVQRSELVRRPVALERTEIVCRQLGALLPPDVATRWARDLPPPVAALFLSTPPAGYTSDAPAPRPSIPRPTPPPSTLATGRPGSSNPVSEAHPERAHRHSVVRADDPHADTRLSASRGLTQERAHETLAEGDARSARPLSEAHPEQVPKPR